LFGGSCDCPVGDCRIAPASDGDWMPGMPRPTGPVPAEPAGAFTQEMHTRDRIDSNWIECADGIKRPAHYANFPIDPVTFALINELPAWKFQVVKYTCRAGMKGDESDDIQKAIRHLEMRLELLKRQRDGSIGHVVGRPL
jgi:hypothetical protein